MAALASAGGLVLKKDDGCRQDTKKDCLYQLRGRIAIRLADDGRYPFAMTDEARRLKSAISNQEPRSTRNEILEAAREKLSPLVWQLVEKARMDYVLDVGSIHAASQPERHDGAHGDIDVKSLACDMTPLPGGEVLLEIHRKKEKGQSDIDQFLDSHMENVASAVEKYAKSLGLGHDGDLVELLCTAARLHDAGKADGRFQQMLYRSTVPLPVESPLRAKDNGLPPGRHKYCLPKGFRHELVSSRLAESVETSDRDLLLHLIESHHGRCRPNAPPVKDPDAVPVEYVFKGTPLRTSPATGLERVGSGASRRFWSCTRTYGWWGLAWIVALFLLADWGVSRGTSQ